MPYKKIVFCLFTLLSFHLSFGQITKENKCGCKTISNAAGDEMTNTKKLYMSRTTSNYLARSRQSKTDFPIRFLYVSSNIQSNKFYDDASKNLLQKLNKGFENTDITFSLHKSENIKNDLLIEELHENGYQKYVEFSTSYDLQDIISVYIFDYDPSLCVVEPTSISCNRTSGFSYILSNVTNNIVLSSFDIADDKIIVHEMGHFFGLYHTFEEAQFGKDNFIEDCNVAGDCLCDTPPDPGAAFEVYVNYSQCEMINYYHDNGNKYQPLINNYMGYYKPCYLKEYSFSANQVNILNMSAESEFRRRFGR